MGPPRTFRGSRSRDKAKAGRLSSFETAPDLRPISGPRIAEAVPGEKIAEVEANPRLHQCGLRFSGMATDLAGLFSLQGKTKKPDDYGVWNLRTSMFWGPKWISAGALNLVSDFL